MNQTIFEGIRGDNENFIVLLYDFDLCQNSAHVKLHSSKAEQCAVDILKMGEICKILDLTRRTFHNSFLN